MTSPKDPDLLAELYHEYVTRTPAHAAIAHFKELSEKGNRQKLKRLLRHHDEEAISDRETWIRDRYDYLLTFYSLVEIACSLGLMPKLPAGFAQEARTFLSDSYVRRYYEENYPLLVPELLRRRVCGAALAFEDAIPEAEKVFEKFRRVGSVIDQEDEETDTFLWLLDGGNVDVTDVSWGKSVSNLILTISDPEKFVRSLAAGAAGQDRMGQALIGLSSFLDFCDQFQNLLASLNQFPLQQSLLWHHHAYWFDQLRREVSVHIQQALNQFTLWNSKDGKGALPSLGIKDAIAQLTSGRYGWRLYELAYRNRVDGSDVPRKQRKQPKFLTA